MPSLSEPKWTDYLVAVLSIGGVTLLLKMLGGHVNALDGARRISEGRQQP